MEIGGAVWLNGTTGRDITKMIYWNFNCYLKIFKIPEIIVSTWKINGMAIEEWWCKYPGKVYGMEPKKEYDSVNWHLLRVLHEGGVIEL